MSHTETTVLEILTRQSEIAEGRRQLEALNASLYPPKWRRLLARLRRKLHFPGRPVWGDWTKSWDVAKTVEFIRERVGYDERVLDLGCFNSEVLWSLARLGYRDLAGCDLNPECIHGPSREGICYSVQDLTHTSYPSASCKAISCISVIEHGIQLDAFLAETRRLLKPGGFLVLSTDYWPTPIDSSGIQEFDLPWRIFSRADLEDLLVRSLKFGLEPVGPLNWRDPAPVISWRERHYSFAWIAFSLRQ